MIQLRQRATAVLAWSVAGSSLAAGAILVAVRPDGELPTAHRIAGVVAGTLFVSSALFTVGRRWRSGPAPARRGDGRDALILAGAGVAPLLLIPTYLLARSAFEPDREAVLYAFLDRRWLAATFLVGTLGVMLMTSLSARVVEGGGGTQPTGAIETPAPRPRHRTALALAAAVLIALYFFGPPWNIDAGMQPVDSHETFQLGAIQAVDNGRAPYVGEAASQYGPGTQIASFAYMKAVGGDSVVGFRGSYALFNWIAATLLFSLAVVRMRFALALAAVAVAILLFPTLQEFEFERMGWDDAGTLTGFFGWFNALRYIGAIGVVVLLPWAAGRRAGELSRGIGLGVVWGLSCYLAQENLGAGIVGLLALGALLVLSSTATLRATARVLAGVALGAALVALGAVLIYATQGRAGELVSNYFFVASAVTAGYSNTPFVGGFGSEWGPMFYVLPAVLAAVGLASLLKTRPLRVATRWNGDRVVLVSLVVACVAVYTGALFRSDPSHLFNAILAVPLLAVAAVALLPRVLGVPPGRGRVASGAAVAAAFALLLPVEQFGKAPERLAAPLTARVAMLGGQDRPAPRGVAAQRMGGALARAPRCCTSSLIDSPESVSMPRFTAFLGEVREAVGTRRTYVTFGRGQGMPGLVYFGADLEQAFLSTEPGTLLVDGAAERDFLADFGAHAAAIQALVTTETAPNPERDLFIAAHPEARQTTLSLGGLPVHVFLAD